MTDWSVGARSALHSRRLWSARILDDGAGISIFACAVNLVKTPGGPVIGHGAESLPCHSFWGFPVFRFDEKHLRFARSGTPRNSKSLVLKLERCSVARALGRAPAGMLGGNLGLGGATGCYRPSLLGGWLPL